MATFTNQATLSYSGGTINSNITTGEIVEVLSATKTAVVDTYYQNSDVTYVINIVNSGATAFSGLTLTDNLGAYTFGEGTLVPLDYVENSVKYFVDGELQTTPVISATSPLTITGIIVPANSVATVVYTTNTNEFAPPASDGLIENTAVISGGGITELTVEESVASATSPNLTITKSVTPSVVTENGQITYSFVIQNIGNTEAVFTDNIVVTDTFNPILTGVTVAYNGVAWTTPTNYTYNEATGEFATVAGGITVPAATFTQNATTGAWVVEPGVATLTVTGTV